MVIVTLTDCPPKLRGDLSKWLMEINTGVYIGKINARVREKLWKRICENLTRGRATMAFSVNNEQGYDFYIYNTTWEPIDFEGIKLIKRPNCDGSLHTTETKSKAGINRMLDGKQKTYAEKKNKTGYVIIDVETTGLDSENDDIIELAAIRVIDHQVADMMSVLVKVDREIPESIIKLTGITQKMMEEQGVYLKEALIMLFDFIESSPLVSHNISFDRAFINEACRREGVPGIRNVCKDTLALARRKIDDVQDYKLATLVKHFNIRVEEEHRALADCKMTFELYEKLNEI